MKTSISFYFFSFFLRESWLIFGDFDFICFVRQVSGEWAAVKGLFSYYKERMGRFDPRSSAYIFCIKILWLKLNECSCTY